MAPSAQSRRRTRGISAAALLVCLTLAAVGLRSNTPQSSASSSSPACDHPGQCGALTKQELKMAQIAWKYFQNNTQPETGLANAVDKYPSTTMWDTASYLGALVSAYELGIIEKNEFDRRMTGILQTFNRVSFFRDELPNKVYNTKSAEKVNYANAPGEIGFSAIDLGRLLIWLKIIKERYPAHSNGIDNFVRRWKFCNVLDACGTMYGAVLTTDKQVRYLQEGRLGYEEYAAKGFQLWGFNTDLASRAEPYGVVPILGVLVPYDTRDPRDLGAHNYVVSENYILDGIEMNWDLPSDKTSNDFVHTDKVVTDFAQRIFQVQENRYKQTGILTARTEHQLAAAPYFVYDTIYSDGYPWNTITEDGKFVPEHAAVSLKAALGLWALSKTEYSQLLFDTVSDLYDPERGFYEGRYEKDGGVIGTYTANNNGIILESLLYKVQGKLLKFHSHPNLWDTSTRDEFQGKQNCMPQFQRNCGILKLRN
jgi:hypothetical protein